MNKMSQSVAARVEELLREQLEELGITPSGLQPHDIAKNMRCEVFPDDSMVYIWQETQLLRVLPEKDAEGRILRWRMFTRDDTVGTVH